MRSREVFRQLLCPPRESFSLALRSGIGGGKRQAERRNGLSEARSRSDAANARRKRDATAVLSLPSATSARCNHLQRALVADSPRKPLLLGLADFPLVALSGRDWRPLRWRAKDSWTRHSAVRVSVGWPWTVRPVPFEWLPVAPRLVYLDDVAFSAWLNPVLRDSSERWSDARLQSRHSRARSPE